MTSRTRTFATFFTVALAATLLGALFTTHAGSPPPRPFGAGGRTATATAVPVALQAGDSGASLGLNTFSDIARAVNDGVVNINTEKLVRRPRSPFHEFFGGQPNFGQPDDDDRIRQTSLGSGFVIDAEGYILTNRHVIEGADEISVTFPDGKRYEAKVIGQDARTDVALIKIEPEETLTVLPMGDSDSCRPGEWVMAIGNPFGLGNSVSVGVVSFHGRDVPLQRYTSIEMIQTDAAINPGNSGGPLLNARGEVIGINTMIMTDGASRVNAGVGFSVPINVATEILPQLRERGKVIRGWMGVTIQAVTDELAETYGLDEAKGAIVSSVTADSPAEDAGIEPEDVILAADGRAIGDNGDLSRYIASKAPGTEVELDVFRDGRHRTISITLGTFPEDPRAPGARTEDTDRPRLGMSVRDLTPDLAQRVGVPQDTRGVLITDVETGEPAEEAGLVPGDVIVSVNGETVESVNDFEKAIGGFEGGDRIRLRVRSAQGYRIVVLRLK
ncbi:MAG: Do family serine endopeptidase [Acidobacteria bacterium]|nr:Do family serine endopeptidase [Acidobacteriota bacterium]